MNIRIGNQNIRFKVTEDELGQLLSGDTLEINSLISARIIPNGSDILVKHNNGELILMVSKQRLLELMDMGKNREGISAQQGDLSLYLQVDVRKDSRLKAK